MASELTQARLQELLQYEEETGIFRWKFDRSSNARSGDVAGTLCRGYIQISIDDRLYKGHRLAFLYMLGRWPDPEADHEDLDRSNNRWKNLREATRSQNLANKRVRGDNKLGTKGVHRRASGRYGVQVSMFGKTKHIGVYDTPELAAWMYGVVAEALFGEFARLA